MRNHTGIALRLAIAFASILAGMMALARTGQAQESYPSKPIQLVVTTAAGGALGVARHPGRCRASFQNLCVSR